MTNKAIDEHIFNRLMEAEYHMMIAYNNIEIVRQRYLGIEGSLSISNIMNHIVECIQNVVASIYNSSTKKTVLQAINTVMDELYIIIDRHGHYNDRIEDVEWAINKIDRVLQSINTIYIHEIKRKVGGN